MQQSAHFINKRDGSRREGLTRIQGNRYASCCWAISAEDATALVGGWIYLHETKGDRSVFGGAVEAVEATDRLETASQTGYKIYFEAKADARGQAWRGAGHDMAWWSGLVDADSAHESASDVKAPTDKGEPPMLSALQ